MKKCPKCGEEYQEDGFYYKCPCGTIIFPKEKNTNIEEFEEYAHELKMNRDKYSRAYIIEHLVDKAKELMT